MAKQGISELKFLSLVIKLWALSLSIFTIADLGESLAALESMTKLSRASSGQYFIFLGKAYPKQTADYFIIVLLSYFEKVSCGILQGRGNSKDIKAVMATAWGLLKCIEVPSMFPPRLSIKPGPDCLGLILFFISFMVVCHISLNIFNIKHNWLCSLTKLAPFLSKWRDLIQKPVWELRSCN